MYTFALSAFDEGWCPPLVPSSQFEHFLHHRSNTIVDLVDRSVAHVGTGGDQLVLLIHMALTNALAHVLTAQLVDCCSGVCGVWIPKWQYKLLNHCITSQQSERE